MNFRTSIPQLPNVIIWVLMILTTILFMVFPLQDRVLFQSSSHQIFFDLFLIGAGVFFSRKLIKSIYRHFWRYRTTIRPWVSVAVQWSISLFIWSVMTLPLTWSFFEWSYTMSPAESQFFQTDVLLALGLFAIWSLIVFVYPYWKTPNLQQPVAAEVSVVRSM